MIQLRTVLVPTDFSACAEHALVHATYLADRYGADLHILHVRVPGASMAEGLLTGLIVTPEEVCEQLHIPHEPCRQARGRGQVVRAEVEHSSAVEGILEYAAEHAVDLVVMGSHGRTGLQRLVMGSVAERVVRQAACPVMVVGGTAAVGHPARRVLIPTDFSEPAREAMPVAVEVAAAYGAELHVLHVVEPAVVPSLYGFENEAGNIPALIDEARETLDKLAQDIASAGVRVHVEVCVGHPVVTILDYAKEAEVGLIVMASHGRTGLPRFVLGSVAERVVREAFCPTLVVKTFGKPMLAQAAAEAEPQALA